MHQDTEKQTVTMPYAQSAEPLRHNTLFSRLMPHFFTEDVSPDNYPLIELQRRVCWVGLALIAQALNEIDRKIYLPYVRFLIPWESMIPFVLIVASFVAMWMAFRPTALKKRVGKSSASQSRPRRWQRIVLVMVLLTSIAGGIEFGRSIAMGFFMPPQYTNDGTSIDTNAASLLLEGRNPYTDSSILSLVRRFPIQPYWTTPLRQGQLADALTYPSTWELRTILDTDLKAGTAPEFESKVSYPSLSFLTLLPFVWLNIYNVLPFYLLCYLLLVIIGLKVVRPEIRPWLLLLSLANVSMWTSVVGGNVDLLYILFIVLAWLAQDSRRWSAIFLGLAIASKQPAWLFVPFYAIMILRQYNFKEVLYRLSIAGIIALALNLPFILWSPQAWFAGVLAPIADPMFPLGVGLIAVSFTPLVPILPGTVYLALEAIAMLFCLGWYWRICKQHPESAMLLAVLPLFFAWRSLPSYFYCAAFPIIILQAAYTLPNRGGRPRKALRPAWRLQFAPPETNELPVGITSHAATRFFHALAKSIVPSTRVLNNKASIQSQPHHSPAATYLPALPWIPPPKSIA
ncbi:MAG: hypothetical protein E6I93_16910 [Chloroflexi bacterium]|nr:MAG: hypothetical protein E6I93_16910 [Chloroflexota bacterium]